MRKLPKALQSAKYKTSVAQGFSHLVSYNTHLKGRMEFTRSTQNENKVLFEGHAYVKKYDLTDNWESFECERRRNHDRCPGKVKVKGNQIQVTKGHSHGPNPARNEVLKVSAAIKRLSLIHI